MDVQLGLPQMRPRVDAQWIITVNRFWERRHFRVAILLGSKLFDAIRPSPPPEYSILLDGQACFSHQTFLRLRGTRARLCSVGCPEPPHAFSADISLRARRSSSSAIEVGLMATGQSGAVKSMGPSGNVAAQSWNALLAGLGAAEYNQKARQRQKPVRYRPPKTIKTEYETQAQSVRDDRRRRSAN